MNEIGVVIYTDGGAEPPRGAGGSGVFGYTYEIDSIIEPKLSKDEYAPTNKGYFTKDTKPADCYWVQPIEELEGLISFPMPVTNNIAELSAGVHALEEIVKQPWKTITLRPDSQYFMQGYVEHLPKWIRDRWMKSDGTPVRNQRQWQQVEQLKNEIARLGKDVQFIWVKGHSGEPGNLRADALATLGKDYAKQSQAIRKIRYGKPVTVTLVDEKSSVPDINRMFDARRWYFTNDKSEDLVNELGYHVYYTGAHGKDDHLAGKPTSETSYSVLWLKEPDKVLEMIRDTQAEVCRDNSYSEMVIGDLDAIFSKKNYSDIANCGTGWVHTIPKTRDLISAYGVQLTREASPARLAMDLVKELVRAEDFLRLYQNQTCESNGVKLTDVTDQLYDITKKKDTETFKLKKDIGTGVKTVQLQFEVAFETKPIETVKTSLMLGVDLPKRNTLSALAKRGIKITVGTYPLSDISYGIVTFVESDGDLGVWYGSPANLRLV